ncbi:hypothetical protein LLG90_27570, partial [Aromatoleum toluclasticum]|nr:hypothetical protein [Aromatoleum toluclasticum]
GRNAPAGVADLRRQLNEFDREFAHAIRAGRADAGAWHGAARQHLQEPIRAKVMESNPTYLGGLG